MHGAGARAVRLAVAWNAVAPARRPPTFRADDPTDPAYNWAAVDRQVTGAVAAGLEPLLSIASAPRWAERGAGPRDLGRTRPDPAELGRFASAAAKRYSGALEGLPRVRYWQVWNEPNLAQFLWPQYVDGQVVSARHYRRMVNAFADAVHGVRQDNLVVAGGLAPFTSRRGRRAEWGTGPLNFMRSMLCVSRQLKATCPYRSKFDVWAHHPYTTGGPTHNAYRRDDVSLGDLPEMGALLRASVRAKHVSSRGSIRFWVTEFSWNTRPPHREGMPLWLHARWTAEALYRMWTAGVSLVTWWLLRDDHSRSHFQSGLYFRGSTLARDRPKRSLAAFRFPFVALPEHGAVRIWGRTPTSRPGRIVIEQTSRGRWMRRAVVAADRYGVFTARVKAPVVGSMRARTGDDRSLAFGVKPVPDRVYRPFGRG